MLPLLYEAFVYSLDFYLRKQIEKKGSCNLTKKRGSKSRFGCSVANSSETKNRSSGSRGIGPALLVRFALTSGPGFGTSKRVPLTRCGSYGSMVVFSTTLNILSGVCTTPRVRTNRTDSTATFPPPHVGRSRGLRSEKLCKKKFRHVLVQRSLRSAGPHTKRAAFRCWVLTPAQRAIRTSAKPMRGRILPHTTNVGCSEQSI